MDKWAKVALVLRTRSYLLRVTRSCQTGIVRQESGAGGGGGGDDKHRPPPAQPCLEPTVRGKVGSRCLLGRGLLSGVGRCKEEVIQAPHASPRGLLHVGFWRGSEADPWCLSPEEDRTQWAAGGTGSLACCSCSSTGAPGAGRCQEPLASGSECQHQTQLRSAVCRGDSRYPEVRDSTPGGQGPWCQGGDRAPQGGNCAAVVGAACTWAVPSGRKGTQGRQRRLWYR